MNSKKIFWMISLFLGSSLAFSQMGMAQTYGGSMTNPSYSYQTSDMKNLIGAKVINLQGEDLGKIADVTISPADNSQYLIVSPNLPQMNNQFVALPYSLVSGQPTSGTVTVDLSKDKFASAPTLQSNQWASGVGTNWSSESSRYFGVAPHYTQPSAMRGAQVTTDAAILSDIHSRFSQDPSLKDSRIQVFSEAGNITLNGFVPNTQAEKRAVNMASQVAGVKSVKDNLMVESSRAQMTGQTAQNRMDRRFNPQAPVPYIGGGPAAADPQFRSQVVGAEVVNTQGDHLGRVVDVTVGSGSYEAATREADPNFIIVSPYMRELNGKLVAIPYTHFESVGSMTSPRGQRELTVDISKDQFLQAPTIDQYAWPMGVRSSWATDSYRYFGQTPYFK